MKLKNKPVTVSGNGTSIWGESKGRYQITSIKVGYINWVAYPDDECEKLHASVDMYGPNTECIQYTDRGIVNSLNRNDEFKRMVKEAIQSKLDANKIYRELPKNIEINWSETGMQPVCGWNFDVNGKA